MSALPIGQPTLFREEAVRFQEQYRTWGEVARVQPLSTKLLSWLLILATVSASTFLCFTEYSRKETVRGYLTPATGTSKIFVPQSGTINAVYISEGQSVEPGQPLLTIETAQFSGDGTEVNAAILSALTTQREDLIKQISAQERRTTSERERLTALISGADAELLQLETQIRAQSERIRLSQELIRTAGQLNSKGYITDVELNRRRSAALEAEQTLSALHQQFAARQNQLTETRYSLQQLPIIMSDKIQAVRNELSRIDQKIAELNGRRSYVIRAPAGGRVSTLQATVGQAADPQKLQMEIVPAAAMMRAELLVPSKAIGFVVPGQTVRIMYDAFPYQRFGTYAGQIVRVSQTIVKGAEATGPLIPDEPAYRVTAVIDRSDIEVKGKRVPLQPDMLLRADIILEKRPLIKWLLDPLLGSRL